MAGSSPGNFQGYVAVRRYFSIASGKTHGGIANATLLGQWEYPRRCEKTPLYYLAIVTPAGNGAAFVFFFLPEQEYPSKEILVMGMRQA
jgi:hypothetical protein